MEQGRYVHFFCPQKRNDVGVQTTNFFLDTIQENDSNLYELIHDSCENSLLTQSYSPPSSRLEIHFINEVRSKVGFVSTNLREDRFDTLTPPEITEDNRHHSNLSNQFLSGESNSFFAPDLYFEFKESHFFITSLKTNTSCKYDYNSNSNQLFNSIMRNIITDKFFASIDHSISDNIKFENGCCLCDITDYRFQPTVHKQIILKINQSNSQKFLSSVLSSKSSLYSFIKDNSINVSELDISQITDDKLKEIKTETEKKILLKFHPTICTDPSPDVARFQSICDFRTKMWKQNDEVKNKPHCPSFSTLFLSQNPQNEHSCIDQIKPTQVQAKSPDTEILLPSYIRNYFDNYESNLDSKLNQKNS